MQARSHGPGSSQDGPGPWRLQAADLANALGADPGEWLRDFVAAAYADDAVAGVDRVHTQPSWDFRTLFLDPPFPAVRLLTEDIEQSFTLSAGGSAAFIRFGVAAQGQGLITLTSGGSPVVSSHPLIVLRTR